MKKTRFRWRSLILTVVLFFCSLHIALSFPVEKLPLIEQGKKLYRAEQFQEAATVWQQAANMFARQGDSLNQAMALSNVSLSEQRRGRWQPAKQAITESLNLLQALKKTPEQQKILASTLDIQGQLQLAIGQPTTALEAWQQAADIYREIGDSHGQIRSQINQAQAMQDLGLYPRACATLLTTLAIEHQDCNVSEREIQNLDDSVNKNLQILALSSLGNVLRVVGQAERSQQVLLVSGRLARDLGDTQNLAAIYLSLGNTARILANREKQPKNEISEPVDCLNSHTEHFYQQAAACYRQAESFSSTRIPAQLNLLSLSLQKQQFSEIATLLPKIQNNLAALPPTHNTLTAHLKLAQNLICLKSDTPLSPVPPILQQCPATGFNDLALSWSDIEEIVTVALNQARLLENQQAEANALGYLGAISQQMGDLSQAQQLTERALQLLSAYNSPDITYLWQWQLGHLYQQQGESALAIKSYTLAFKLLQSLRGDLVASNRDLQFTFRDSVEPVYRELVNLLLQAEPTQDDLNLARHVIEALQLAELNNFFQEACLEAKPQSIEQLDPHAAIIYPILLPNRLAVILSLPRQPLRYYTTELKETGEIENTFDSLFANLNPYISSADPLRPHQQFYDWLIRPTETELASNKIETLVFVLDGILRSVPMAALYDGQQYLIEKYNVVLTPGLQLLDPKSLSQKDFKTLAGGLAEARQGFPSLPGVEREVREIARLVPSEVLLDGEFTLDRLRTEVAANTFPVIHLATHGQFSSQAEDTFLLTWDERINVKDVDRLLQERNRDPIELLILSACQTAVGDRRAALGLAGVAVRSGARSTLATLWSVQDQSTADLMTRFYEFIKQSGVNKGEALRQAQLTLLRSPQYQHPYYWAPFVLVGNWL
jgi:CHAT domain-containing protein